MFNSFEYIGWSDASVKNGICYIAYGIKRVGETKFTFQETFRVYDVTDTKEAEYLAAYAMVKSAAEKGLNKVLFYTDCIRVWRDVMGINEEYKTGRMKQYKKLFEKMFVKYKNLSSSTFLWEVRKANLAHKLFEAVEGSGGYTTEEIITGNYSVLLSQKELLGHIRHIEGTDYMILSSAHKDYFFLGNRINQRSIEEYEFNTISKSLVKNIKEASLYEKNDRNVLVKGKLHLYLIGNVITKITIENSELTEKWRKENGATVQDNKENMHFKLRQFAKDQVTLPLGKELSVTKAALMKLSKANLLDFDEEQDKLFEILRKAIKLGVAEQFEGYSVYHYGECHIQLQDNIIADLKIAA